MRKHEKYYKIYTKEDLFYFLDKEIDNLANRSSWLELIKQVKTVINNRIDNIFSNYGYLILRMEYKYNTNLYYSPSNNFLDFENLACIIINENRLDELLEKLESL